MKIEVTPILDSLKGKYLFIDNELQDGIVRMGLFSIFARHGVSKRSGEKIEQLIFALLIWPFLGLDSVASFCGKMIDTFYIGGKDVLYRFLRRENINWRLIAFNLARTIFDKHGFHNDSDSAFVVDDTLKHRRGKKVEGVSSHFDHTECRHVLAQQVLQLGLTGQKGFIPLFQQIYIGSQKIQGLNKEFKDKRSAVAKDYQTALEMNKNEMLRSMLKRAIRLRVKARHLLGDTWFGNKKNIETAIELGVTAIFMMKRGNLHYRYQGKEYTAKMLYELIKRRMKAGRGQRFRTFSLSVEINLSGTNWIPVTLLFSKPRKETKDGWCVILCTDTSYSAERILELYALRWGIEVYFKEVKQGMGWMKEQSGRYTVHYASIHLAAIRYLLVFGLMLDYGGIKFGEMRNRITGAMEQLGFASMLWELFKALLHGILDSFESVLGKNVLKKIKSTIDSTIEDFLLRALQMDADSLRTQRYAEKIATV